MGKKLKIHDYREGTRRWGHDFSLKVLPEKTIMTGWGHGIKAGHYLLTGSPTKLALYIVDVIEYYRDPRDMWYSTVRCLPVDSIPDKVYEEVLSILEVDCLIKPLWI